MHVPLFPTKICSVALALDTRSKRLLTRRVLVLEKREGDSLLDRILGLVSQGPSIRDQAYEGAVSFGGIMFSAALNPKISVLGLLL
jgi:hypothetical protein